MIGYIQEGVNSQKTNTYQHFFTGRPTPEIAQDLLGRTLTYQGPMV